MPPIDSIREAGLHREAWRRHPREGFILRPLYIAQWYAVFFLDTGMKRQLGELLATELVDGGAARNVVLGEPVTGLGSGAGGLPELWVYASISTPAARRDRKPGYVQEIPFRGGLGALTERQQTRESVLLLYVVYGAGDSRPRWEQFSAVRIRVTAQVPNPAPKDPRRQMAGAIEYQEAVIEPAILSRLGEELGRGPQAAGSGASDWRVALRRALVAAVEESGRSTGDVLRRAARGSGLSREALADSVSALARSLGGLLAPGRPLPAGLRTAAALADVDAEVARALAARLLARWQATSGSGRMLVVSRTVEVAAKEVGINGVEGKRFLIGVLDPAGRE